MFCGLLVLTPLMAWGSQISVRPLYEKKSYIPGSYIPFKVVSAGSAAGLRITSVEVKSGEAS
jgi:hypothetical protein